MRKEGGRSGPIFDSGHSSYDRVQYSLQGNHLVDGILICIERQFVLFDRACFPWALFRLRFPNSRGDGAWVRQLALTLCNGGFLVVALACLDARPPRRPLRQWMRTLVPRILRGRGWDHPGNVPSITSFKNQVINESIHMNTYT